jgi:tetratricopeptide (TPR) repeat protein
MARGQTLSYQQVDSTSYMQYRAANWPQLIEFGNNAIAGGVDYPVLRLRMAYAQFVLGNYSGALAQYQQVLKNDSHNQMACYFSFLCNKYLNRNTEASYHAALVDTATLNKETITPFGLIEAGLETSAKASSNANRGTGIYTLAHLNNRLGWRVQLDEAVGYYNQSITVNSTVTPAGGAPAIANATATTFSDSQLEYYAKLSYSATNNLVLLGAYHYLNTSLGNTSYQNHVGLIGLRFSAPYFTLQADANISSISNTHVQQYNGALTVYPLGNLNLYSTTRVSAQSGAVQQTIVAETLGFKVTKHLWLEASGTFGKLDNYLDADALYVYNAIDVTQTKVGSTAFVPLGHAIIYLNYTFEQKQDYYLNTNYNQNSITGGFTWKF